MGLIVCLYFRKVIKLSEGAFLVTICLGCWILFCFC